MQTMQIENIPESIDNDDASPARKPAADAPVISCTDPLPGIPLKLIIGNEFAERFCYYGTRSLLVIYLTDKLGFKDDAAVSVVSLYIAGCYLSPLLGGYVADGKNRGCEIIKRACLSHLQV